MSKQLPLKKPLTIISGGQTGADLAGLLAAEHCGIPTTGWAPKGFKTEKGSQPLLGKRFGLIEHSSASYPPRTEENIIASQLTLLLGTKLNSPGSKKTVDLCIKHQRAFVEINDFSEAKQAEIKALLQLMRPSVINVAGNRESVSPRLTQKARQFLVPLFEFYKQYKNAPPQAPC